MVNGMVLLPNWTDSMGALTEVHIGLSLGMPFFKESDGNLIQQDITYRKLINAMQWKYGGREVADTSDLPEAVGGDSRETEGWQDNTLGIPSVYEPGLVQTFVRPTVEGGLPDDGSGRGRSQSDQRPTSLAGHRFVFPWQRPVVVDKPARPEREAGVPAGD
jgi:hypothetical protein